MLDEQPQNFRIGSVPYLNAAPLTRGLEGDLTFATPAKLAEMLRRDELDAALVSITEVLLNDRYDVLDGIAIASLGEVYSVFLAHKKPLAEIKEVYCDTASLTSVNLLKVLLAERGLKPEFKPLEDYSTAPEKDFVLLIGDPAIDFQRAPHTHEIFDLGTAWMELTSLPFVFAVWALRRGIENTALRRGELRSSPNASAWKASMRSSWTARNTMRTSAAITSSGTFSTISATTKSAPSKKFCQLLQKHTSSAPSIRRNM